VGYDQETADEQIGDVEAFIEKDHKRKRQKNQTLENISDLIGKLSSLFGDDICIRDHNRSDGKAQESGHVKSVDDGIRDVKILEIQVIVYDVGKRVQNDGRQEKAHNESKFPRTDRHVPDGRSDEKKQINEKARRAVPAVRIYDRNAGERFVEEEDPQEEKTRRGYRCDIGQKLYAGPLRIVFIANTISPAARKKLVAK
jgi:hypothetical protein